VTLNQLISCCGSEQLWHLQQKLPGMPGDNTTTSHSLLCHSHLFYYIGNHSIPPCHNTRQQTSRLNVSASVPDSDSLGSVTFGLPGSVKHVHVSGSSLFISISMLTNQKYKPNVRLFLPFGHH
jgi:hypothetical protein